jgi:hypothetical protein
MCSCSSNYTLKHAIATIKVATIITQAILRARPGTVELTEFEFDGAHVHKKCTRFIFRAHSFRVQTQLSLMRILPPQWNFTSALLTMPSQRTI